VSPPRSPLHGVAIVGAYNTAQAKALERPELDVLLDAVDGALASAGMRLQDIDGFNVTSSTQRFHARQAVMLFGGRPCWTGADIGIPAIIEAALAIAAGLCDSVVIATAHTAYDYGFIVENAPLVIDTRNATKTVASGREKIVKA